MCESGTFCKSLVRMGMMDVLSPADAAWNHTTVVSFLGGGGDDEFRSEIDFNFVHSPKR